MANLDYKKVFDAAAASLEARADMTIEALDLGTYRACIKLENGSSLILKAIPGEYSMELSFAKESLEHRGYMKFLSRFEYNLEQKFLKNIKIDTHEIPGEYRIKISF